MISGRAVEMAVYWVIKIGRARRTRVSFIKGRECESKKTDQVKSGKEARKTQRNKDEPKLERFVEVDLFPLGLIGGIVAPSPFFDRLIVELDFVTRIDDEVGLRGLRRVHTHVEHGRG
jgi:hypothetical protein